MPKSTQDKNCLFTDKWKNLYLGLETEHNNAQKKAFISRNISTPYKRQNYKAYILKYKAHILKYMPCIFYKVPYVFFGVAQALFFMCFIASQIAVFASRKQPLKPQRKRLIFAWMQKKHYLCTRKLQKQVLTYEERCQSDRMGRTRNPLYGLSVPGVWIPLFPQSTIENFIRAFSFTYPPTCAKHRFRQFLKRMILWFVGVEVNLQ